MPFIGLVITSAGFLIPAVLSFRKKNIRDAAATGLLAVTSVLYHGTLHPLAHLVDDLYAHVIGALYFAESVRRRFKYRRKSDIATFRLACASVLCYYVQKNVPKGVQSARWHMGVHLCANTAWTIYIMHKH
jgi:hypothetical protein